MAKQDGATHEETNRDDKTEPVPEKQQGDSPEAAPQQGFTEVKNAHASGMGATGRADEEEDQDSFGANSSK